jgi:hypothetical protein
MTAVLYNLGFPLCAALIWAAFAFKLRDLQRRAWRDGALRAICVSFGCAGVAFTLATPSVYWRVDQLLGVPNLATLLIYGGVLVLSVSAQVLLLIWIGPPDQTGVRVRRRLLLSGLALAAMVVLFVRAPVPVEEPYDFDARYATTPYVAQFLLIYLVAFAVGYTGIARLCWRYAAVAGRPWLSRGLRLTAIGAGFAVGYCTCKAIYLIGRHLGQNLMVWNLAAPVSAVIGVPFLVVGLTIPAWGPRLSSSRAWLRHYRAHRALYPLWRFLYEAVPEIALEPPPGMWQGRLRLRHLSFALHRRIVEIHDAQLVLRPYRDPRVAEAAATLAGQAGLDGENLRALAEAASLASAVQNAKVQHEVGTPAVSLDAIGRNHSSPVGADLSSEIAWLTRVARFTASPLVAAALAATARSQQGASPQGASVDPAVQPWTAPGRRWALRPGGRDANLDQIQRLDPQRDCHEIYRTMVLVEFAGWDGLTGLAMAFYWTYAVPAIAERLEQAGELTGRPRKRAVDTALLMLELVDHGVDHQRGQAVVRRLQRIHRRYAIGNAEYLYVLGALIVVPIRWLDRYGWRPTCWHERAATHAFYQQLGRRMGITEIPPTYEAFEQWFDAYVQAHARMSPASQRLWQASRALLVGRFPRRLGPVAGALVDALLDDRLREAVGASVPPWPIRAALHLTLRLRAQLLRFRPVRGEPVEADGVKYGINTRGVYPAGYEVADLGPTDRP